MWTLVLGVAFGLLAPSRSDLSVLSRSCSYAGTFHIEGRARYALNFQQAQDACQALGTTLASGEQVMAGHSKGLETCRYGWLRNQSLAILRQQAHHLCGNNQTGVIFLNPSVDESYDAFCFDGNNLTDKNCEAEIKSKSTHLDSSHKEDGETLFTTTSPSAETGTTTNGPDGNETFPGESVTPPGSTQADDLVIADPKTQEPTSELDDNVTANPDKNLHTTTEESMEDTVDGKEALSDVTGSGIQPEGSEDSDYITPTMPPVTVNNHPSQGKAPDQNGTAKAPLHVNPRGRMGAVVPTQAGQNDKHIPGWLIVVAVLVAVAAIVLVSAAVANRNRWCGKKQKLTITKEGAEGNGAATASSGASLAQEREQEMVTLMHNEKIQENGNTEFTVITLEESPEKAQLA